MTRKAAARERGARGARARSLGVALALVVGLLTAQPADAQLPGKLTLTGSRNSYALLTVREETTYSFNGMRAWYFGNRWAGFVIGDDWPHLWSRYTDGPTIPGSAYEPGDRPRIEGVLQPGTHKVYLFADGEPVTIEIPWSAPSVTLEFDAPLDARVTVEEAHAVNGGATLRLPQDGRPGTITSAAVMVDVLFAPAPYRARACFARSPASWRTCDFWMPNVGLRMGPTIDGTKFGGGGTPFQQPTKGYTWYAELVGVATGRLIAATIRYRP
ncbi:MAG TPA: hypothetical protein VNA20_12370 [Frankiaceae bacterium]|nr:hypothetical protein [Frankiaceae bacterium]